MTPERFRPDWKRTLLLSDLKLASIEFVRFQLARNCSLSGSSLSITLEH
jgi:hypothetical protein